MLKKTADSTGVLNLMETWKDLYNLLRLNKEKSLMTTVEMVFSIIEWPLKISSSISTNVPMIRPEENHLSAPQFIIKEFNGIQEEDLISIKSGSSESSGSGWVIEESDRVQQHIHTEDDASSIPCHPGILNIEKCYKKLIL